MPEGKAEQLRRGQDAGQPAIQKPGTELAAMAQIVYHPARTEQPQRQEGVRVQQRQAPRHHAQQHHLPKGEALLLTRSRII